MACPSFRSASGWSRQPPIRLACAFIVSALLVTRLPAAAQDGRPLELQDYYRIENVENGALSPDGTQLAFVRSRIIEAENRRQSEVWLVPTDGSVRPRRLTTPATSASAPRWSPDGTLLAFSADSQQRDEHNYGRGDLWVVNLNGATTRLTDDRYISSQPTWSPDSQFLVFRRQAGLNLVIEAMREEIIPARAERRRVEAAQSEAERAAEALRHEQERARMTRVNRQPAYGAPVDLVKMRADGSGFVRILTADWDLLPSGPRFSPDGAHAYFSGVIGGNTHLFRVPSAGAQVEQITDGDRRLSGFSFSTAFDRVAYSMTDSARPSEMYTAELGAATDRKLTAFNDTLLAVVQLPTAERIRCPSNDGTEVEGWVLLPPGYDAAEGPYPLILTIHGGPHSAYGNSFSFEQQLYAANGQVVVYTNPRGSTGYGEGFLWATWGGWGTLDTEDVLSGVDHAVATYAIDESRMGVTGYSYGGFLTNWIIGHTTRFAAAVTGAGIVNWVSDYGTADIPRTKEREFFGPPWEEKGRERLERQSPIYYAGNVTTPTLFVHGEADHRVPIEEGEQMYTALRKQQVDAEFIRYPDMAHGGWTPWNMVHRYHHQLTWWARYLGADRTARTGERGPGVTARERAQRGSSDVRNPR